MGGWREGTDFFGDGFEVGAFHGAGLGGGGGAEGAFGAGGGEVREDFVVG